MTDSRTTDSGPSADATSVHGPYPSRTPQESRSSGASREEGRVSDTRHAKKKPTVPFHWMPWLLGLLFVACLLFAAWVWYQIFHILV